RLQTVTAKNGATTLQSASYTYDIAGRLQTVTDSAAQRQPSGSLEMLGLVSNCGPCRAALCWRLRRPA
ncbi:MAG: RHS repeat domain-containing protein, partial [Verrucomicrobiia bacterium]